MVICYLVVRMLREFKDIEPSDEREWTGLVQLTLKNANGCLIGLVPA